MMRDDQKIKEDLLRYFPGFDQLAPEEVPLVAACLTLHRFPKGTALFESGDAGQSMFFLCEGRVAFSIKDNAGHPMVLEEIGAGSFFGEVALFGEVHRTARAEAIAEALVLELRETGVQTVFEYCPEMAERILRGMAGRLKKSSTQLQKTYVSLEEAVKSQETGMDRFVDRLVPFFANIWVLCIIIVVTVIFYLPARAPGKLNADDMGCILSVLSLIISVFVLQSQDRDQHLINMMIKKTEERTKSLYEEIQKIHEELRNINREK
jgi:CRP/FNR family transcriptional regulator, cyclic AMP receptor protein